MASSTYSGSTTRTGAGATIVGSPNDVSEGPGPEIMSASSLEGDDVVNSEGENLGEIKEIMIDVQSGRVAYAVLSTGGLLGIGDKLHAIPWGALKLDVARECFILDVDKDRLEAAPGFDKDHWPSMADTTWADEVHAFYGTQRYWQTTRM